MASDKVTQLLFQLAGGDRAALDEPTPLVYRELKRIAGAHLGRERSGDTLQATALVHEAYLRLVDQREANWQNRAHFFGVASQVMRRILTDYARSRQRLKRGGDLHRTSLDEALVVAGDRTSDLVQIDEALTRKEQLNARQARVVELRFFGGLSVEQTAAALDISAPTVKREWAMAKAWLYRELAAV